MRSLILAALVAATCTPSPVPPAPVPSVAGAAGAAPVTPCERACARLVALSCPEAQPTPAGASCAAVCGNVEDSGVASLRPTCVEAATSCDAARACQ